MKNHSIILAVIAMLSLSACASIVSKNRYPVTFSSNPADAHLTITDIRKKEVIYEGKSTTTLELKSGGGFFTPAKYLVKFELDGFSPITQVIDAKFDSWYIGNVVFGGVVGLLIVDPATGAMYKIDPTVVNANFLEQEPTEPISNQLKIYQLENIPSEWSKYLVLIDADS